MYKRYWTVKPTIKGFEMVLVVYGTEDDVREYMESEFGYMPGYCGTQEKELEILRGMGAKFYLAPEARKNR